MVTRPVDEKIVAMKMDNSDFVKKATETTNLMGRFTNFLNKIPGVNFGKTTNELKNIQQSINGMETTRLSNTLDMVTSRFSTLGVVGTTALVNIANRAVDAGLAIAKNLTVKPVMDGFREYETKIGSIQTILANTSKFGTNVDDVTKSLAELNEYADKTIYNFGQMTKNIGLFTNAGLGLEESTSMIKGFSNAAAASGANAEQMARATYQLSQGLASNYILTEDWNSLTQAGMGNDNMRRDLINVAHAMGVLGTSTDHTLKNWKETLSEDKWLTKEVFSTYLQAMAGDLDKAKLKTIGLTEAQADLLLQNAKIGEDAATKARTFTQMAGALVESIGSGWAQTWEIIFGGFDDATKLWTGFSELITEPFEKLTDSRNKFIQSLKDQGVFEEMFVAIGSAIYVVGKAIGAVTGGFDKAFGSDKVGIISSLVSGFKSFISVVTPSEESLSKIATIFQAVGSNVRVFFKIVGELGGSLLKLIPDNLGKNLLSILENFAKMNISFNESILNSKTFVSSFDNLGGVLSWVGDRLGDISGGFAVLGKSIYEVWSILSTGETMTNGMFSKNSAIVTWLVTIGEASRSVIKYIQELQFSVAPITNFFQSFFETLQNGFTWLKSNLSGIGKSISDSMPSGTTLLAGGFVAALVTITGFVLKTVHDIVQIFSEWGNVVDGFADTLDSVSGALDAFALNLQANALLTASIAVGALAVSILLLSKVDGTKIGNSLIAIVGSLTAVIGAMAVMNKYDITGGLQTTASLIGMAVALSIMSIALGKFASLNPTELTKGLIGVVTVMAGISGAFALMGKFNTAGIAVTALQIVAMAAAVLMISKAVREMGSINPGELAKGIGGLAAIIVAISSAFVLMGKFGGNGSSATALQFVAIAGSVLMLVGAIKMISSIETSDLLVGLATITAILGAVAGFAAFTSGKGLLGSAVGLVAIAAAINAMIIPILTLGNMPLDKLGVGLLGMSTALLAIAAASQVMKGSIVGAASILAMAVALNLLIIPISAFAAMGWGPMLIGIAGLGLALGVLAGVALLLAPGAVPLLAFGAAIGLMGLAMMAAGAGMALFSTGLVALAGMSSAAVVTIITTIGALVTGLTSLIPTAVKFVANIIIQVATAVRDNVPKIVSLIAETIINVLTMISSYVPKYAAAAVKLITSLIDAIATEGPKVVQSVVNLLITMVETMANTIEQNGPRFINAFLKLIGEILNLMVEAGTAVVQAMYGWIPGVEKAMEKVSKSAGKTIEGALQTARIGQEKGDELAKGLSSKESVVRRSAEGLSASANAGLSSIDATGTGNQFAGTFISGILARRNDVEEASKQLAGAAEKGTNERLDIHSPSRVGVEQGQFYGEGVAIGIGNSTSSVKSSVDGMSKTVSSGLGSITETVRNKLFLSDTDVKENNKKVTSVGDTYKNTDEETVKSRKKTSKKIRDELSEDFKKSKEYIEDRKYYQQLSLTQELAAWEKIQSRYKKGSEERKQADREVFRVQNELMKEGFEKSKQWIDDRKYYQKLSLEDELASWKKLQGRYKLVSEERKQIDREVFRVQQELIKKKEDAEKAAFDKSKQFIDDEKTFKNISLAEELSDWERVQKRYKKGSEERKQADREVLRVKQEINQRLMSINDEYLNNIEDTNKSLIEEEKRLNDEYKRTYDDRVRTLTDFVGLFDKVKEKDSNNPLTGNQLVENLRGQVNAFATWSDDIRRLNQKGLDEGLLKELEAMGPGAAVEIEALNELTSAQLDQYVELWKRKSELARTQASKELSPIREETNKNIEQLRIETAKQLDTYKDEWVKKIYEIRVGTSDGFVGLKDDMTTIGGDAIDGLKKGMSDKEGPLYEKVKSIAKNIESAIKTTLKIKSPSRVFMAIGGFIGQGLADGISNTSNMVGSQSKQLATTAISSINEFLDKFQSPSFDNEIHFKAILDDSDIHKVDIIQPLQLRTTNSLLSSARSDMLQNGNKTPTDNNRSTVVDALNNTDKGRPIIIQSVLNGRVIAEETFNDISQLISGSTNLDYAMRGV